MRRMLILMAAVFGSFPGLASSQEPEPPIRRAPQEAPPREVVPVPGPEDRSDDLWYGTPRVRPGGDLLEPILELIRKPSGVLDFRPRQVRSYLPDRETAEFLRERR